MSVDNRPMPRLYWFSCLLLSNLGLALINQFSNIGNFLVLMSPTSPSRNSTIGDGSNTPPASLIAEDKDTGFRLVTDNSTLATVGQKGTSMPRKIFVDLGANCGNTFFKYDAIHNFTENNWEVYLWEPSPQMHHFFLDDLAKKCPHVKIVPYAAGVRDGKLELYVHKGQEDVADKSAFRDRGRCDPNSPYNPSGGTSTFKDAKVAGKPVAIEERDFPTWLRGLKIRRGDRFILKIDIEGSELEILSEMLHDTENEDICLTELMEMEFHKNIFHEGTEQYKAHERFEYYFRNRFRNKCGRNVNLKKMG